MKPTCEATNVKFFFTRGSGFISNMIARSCSPISKTFSKKHTHNVPSHVGLLFETTDGPVVFEAHLKYRPGWQGPKPWQILVNRGAEEEETRRLWTVNPELSVNSAQDIWEMCHSQLGLWDYHPGQLGLIYLWRRFKIPIPQSSAKVVCSEAVGRASYPHINLLKIVGVKSFDLLTPANIISGLNSSGYVTDEIF